MINDTSSAGSGPRRDGTREQFWRATLDAFAQSGQSVRAFCRERQVSEPSFYAWRRTLAERGDPARQDCQHRSPAPAFVPIHLAQSSAPPCDSAPIEIVWAQGCCLRLRPPVDAVALREILAALRSLPAGEDSRC